MYVEISHELFNECNDRKILHFYTHTYIYITYVCTKQVNEDSLEITPYTSVYKIPKELNVN